MSDREAARPQDLDNLRVQLWRQLQPSGNPVQEEHEALQGAAAAVPGAVEPQEKGAVEAAFSKGDRPRPRQRLIRRAGTQMTTSKRGPVPEETQSALRPVPRPDLGSRGRDDRYVCCRCGQDFRWPGDYQRHVAGHLKTASKAPRVSWHRRTRSWP